MTTYNIKLSVTAENSKALSEMELREKLIRELESGMNAGKICMYTFPEIKSDIN